MCSALVLINLRSQSTRRQAPRLVLQEKSMTSFVHISMLRVHAPAKSLAGSPAKKEASHSAWAARAAWPPPWRALPPGRCPAWRLIWQPASRPASRRLRGTCRCAARAPGPPAALLPTAGPRSPNQATAARHGQWPGRVLPTSDEASHEEGLAEDLSRCTGGMDSFSGWRQCCIDSL